jgi:hypothetical protein
MGINQEVNFKIDIYEGNGNNAVGELVSHKRNKKNEIKPSATILPCAVPLFPNPVILVSLRGL